MPEQATRRGTARNAFHRPDGSAYPPVPVAAKTRTSSAERDGHLTWAIPLLRDTLRATDPEPTIARLLADLRYAPEGEGA